MIVTFIELFAAEQGPPASGSSEVKVSVTIPPLLSPAPGIYSVSVPKVPIAVPLMLKVPSPLVVQVPALAAPPTLPESRTFSEEQIV